MKHEKKTTHGMKPPNALRASKKRRGSTPPNVQRASKKRRGSTPPNVQRASKKRRGSKLPRKRLLRTRTHLRPRSLRCCPLLPRMRLAPLPAAAPAHWLRLRHWPHWRTPALLPALPNCWPQRWPQSRRWGLRSQCAVRAAPLQREAAQGLRSVVLCSSASSIRRSLPLEFPAGGCRVSQAYHFTPRNTTPKS